MSVLRTYFVLDVLDMTRAQTFYERALGLRANFDSPEWTELDARGTSIALLAGKRAPGDLETGLTFEVEDIAEACARVSSNGGRVVSGPNQLEDVDLQLARVADTEGNRFSIVETG